MAFGIGKDSLWRIADGAKADGQNQYVNQASFRPWKRIYSPSSSGRNVLCDQVCQKDGGKSQPMCDLYLPTNMPQLDTDNRALTMREIDNPFQPRNMLIGPDTVVIEGETTLGAYGRRLDHKGSDAVDRVLLQRW